MWYQNLSLLSFHPAAVFHSEIPTSLAHGNSIAIFKVVV